MKIEVKINNLDKLQRYLENYADSLQPRFEVFIEELLKIGYKEASQSAVGEMHKFENRVSFDTNVNGLHGELVGQGRPFNDAWVDMDGIVHHVTVYPLLMLEFGSARYYLEMPQQIAFDYFGADKTKIGKGSFSIKGHENDYSWYFYDAVKGERKLGTAVRPQRPMLNALIAMQMEINDLAKKVFK